MPMWLQSWTGGPVATGLALADNECSSTFPKKGFPPDNICCVSWFWRHDGPIHLSNQLSTFVGMFKSLDGLWKVGLLHQRVRTSRVVNRQPAYRMRSGQCDPNRPPNLGFGTGHDGPSNKSVFQWVEHGNSMNCLAFWGCCGVDEKFPLTHKF